jgi:hypothetical protein
LLAIDVFQMALPQELVKGLEMGLLRRPGLWTTTTDPRARIMGIKVFCFLWPKWLIQADN